MWCYRWTSTYYGVSPVLLKTPEESITLLFLFPITTLIVQLWFTSRIWIVGSMRTNIWFPLLIATLACSSWLISLWMFSVLARHHTLVTEDANLIFPVGYAWLAGGVVTDAFIFGGLTYYTEMRSQKQRVHHLLSPKGIWGILYRMIECNVLPLIAQIVLVVLITGKGVGFYYTLSDMTIAKVYTFSLLVSLSARGPIQEGVKASMSRQQSTVTFTNRRRTASAVQVRRDVDVIHDSDSEAGGPGTSPWKKTAEDKTAEDKTAEDSDYEDGKAMFGV